MGVLVRVGEVMMIMVWTVWGRSDQDGDGAICVIIRH